MMKLEGNSSANILSAFSPERQRMQSELVKELVLVLNRLHNVSHSERFWNILVIDYAAVAVTRREQLMRSRVYVKPGMLVINGNDFPSPKEKFKFYFFIFLKYILSLKNLLISNKILKENQNIAIGFPDMEAVKSDLGHSIPHYYPFFWGGGNKKKRKVLKEIAAEYKDVYLQNIISLIPEIYVEHFDTLYNDVKLYEPQKKIINVHISPTVFTNIIIAKYSDSGSKLYWYQHGAFYGEMVAGGQVRERAISDGYKTWGWKIEEKDIPWKSYRLENFRLMYEKFPAEIKFDIFICYPEIPSGNDRQFYINLTSNLLESLKDKNVRILARPRPVNKLYSQKKQLDFINSPLVTIDNGLTRMELLMRQSKLVIQFSVPGTNFLECIYVNHPTVGILVNDQPTAIIQPYYDFFLEQGVLHYEFETLIKHINSVDIDVWWQNLLKHPMYIKFKNEFTHPV